LRLAGRDKEDIKRWDADKEDFEDSIPSWRNETEIPQTLEKLDAKEEDIILDLGCGSGRLMRRFVAKCKLAVGIDFSLDSLFVLKKRLDSMGLNNFELVQAAVAALPLKDNIFNKILCVSLLQMIPGFKCRIEVLRDMQRVLKINGELVISVMNYTIARRLLKFMGRSKPQEALIGKEGIIKGGPGLKYEVYYYNFSAPEFKRLLNKYFSIDELSGIVNRIPKVSKFIGKKAIELDLFLGKTPLSYLFGLLLLAKCKKRQESLQ